MVVVVEWKSGKENWEYVSGLVKITEQEYNEYQATISVVAALSGEEKATVSRMVVENAASAADLQKGVAEALALSVNEVSLCNPEEGGTWREIQQKILKT